MRKTSMISNFPWEDTTICYLYWANGKAEQIIDKDSAYNACKLAIKGKTQIVAVWPGKWRTDPFLVDDLVKLGSVFDITVKEDAHGKMIVRKTLEPFPLEVLGYTHLDGSLDTKTKKNVTFYLDGVVPAFKIPSFEKRFSEMLKKKFGWMMIATDGYSVNRSETWDDYQTVSVNVAPCDEYRKPKPVKVYEGKKLPKNVLEKINN